MCYTPGVWDLIHAGHLNIIKRAKLAGDYLIVGVCSDRLVRQTKAEPIVGQDDRAKLLESIHGVDEVYIYDSLDHSEALQFLGVNIFCIGPEFGELPEHRSTLNFCRENKVQTKVIPRYPGVSSTQIRHRAVERQRMQGGKAIAVDFHDCITFDAAFFERLFSFWPGRRYILSGTPESERLKTLNELTRLGFREGENFEKLLLGFEYDRSTMNLQHFKRMREHKLKHIMENNVDVFIDDNPFYVDWIKDRGITTFQMILPCVYTETFGRKDPYFCCHLQEKQFEFLREMHDSDVCIQQPQLKQ